MSGILKTNSGTFINQQGSVPVGDTFAEYDGEEGSVAVGDMVYFDDPDAGMHVQQCPLVMSHEFIGYVDTVYAFNPDYRDGIEVQVGCTAPLGRLSIDDVYTVVVPTDGVIGARGHPLYDKITGRRRGAAETLAKRLHDSNEYSKYYEEERHGGIAAVGEEFVENNPNVCSECANNEFGPNYTEGK